MNNSIREISVKGDVVELKKLIKNDTEIPKGILQDVIFSGWAQGENVEVLELLINAGADINGLEGDFNFTPLFTASLIGSFPSRSLAVTDFLLKKGADPNIKNKNGETALFEAVTKIADKTVKRLIEGGAEINIKNNEGYPLLHKCILAYNFFLADENKEIAKTYVLNNLKHILCANPDFTLTSNEGYTVIQECLLQKTFAETNFTAPVLKELIDHKCPTDVKTDLSNDYKNLSLLALSIILLPRHSFEVINMLANVNDLLEVELDGPNIFELMFYNPKSGIQILKSRPELIKLEDSGNTLLHVAIQSDTINLEIVAFLIDKGIDPNKISNSGNTALSLAIECNVDDNIINFLREK